MGSDTGGGAIFLEIAAAVGIILIYTTYLRYNELCTSSRSVPFQNKLFSESWTNSKHDCFLCAIAYIIIQHTGKLNVTQYLHYKMYRPSFTDSCRSFSDFIATLIISVKKGFNGKKVSKLINDHTHFATVKPYLSWLFWHRCYFTAFVFNYSSKTPPMKNK